MKLSTIREQVLHFPLSQKYDSTAPNKKQILCIQGTQMLEYDKFYMNENYL